MSKRLQIGVNDALTSTKDFIDVWKRTEKGEKVEEEQKLNFENIEILLKTLTPGRWSLLKKLHVKGPMSIRALAKELGGDYKNVYVDVRQLEGTGLIDKDEESRIQVPWDIVEAQLRLAA